MAPQALSLALFVLQEAIKFAPELYLELSALFNKPDPTPADWDALRARVLAQSYKDLVPNSQLAEEAKPDEAAPPPSPSQ